MLFWGCASDICMRGYDCYKESYVHGIFGISVFWRTDGSGGA